MLHSVYAIILMLLLTTQTFASSGETKTVQWDGSSRSEAFQLHGTLTHTEYRTETVAHTCYRDEYAGQACENVARQRCYNSGQSCEDHERCETHRNHDGSTGRKCYHDPICRPVHHCDTYYDYVCRDTYRSVPYTCYRQEQIPFEVKDADTVADVEVILPAFNKSVASAPERISVQLKGQQLSLSGQSPAKEALLVGSLDQQIVANRNGLIQLVGRVQVKALPYALINQALLIQDLSLDSGDVLSFVTADVGDQIPLARTLKLSRNRTLAPDKRLIERELTSAEMEARPAGPGLMRVTVHLRSLGMSEEMNKGDYKVKLTTRIVKSSLNLLNAADLPENAGTEREIKVKR